MAQYPGNANRGGLTTKKPMVRKPSKGRATAAKSGGVKLDDLLGGGFPFRSNIAVQGPAFIGKDTLLAQFVAEGIKFGAPAIVVLTNNTTTQVRKRIVEMDYRLEEHERAGLVTYIDCYSKTVNLMGKNPYASYLNGVQDLEAIAEIIERFQSGYKGRYFYHRVVFDSLSAVIRAHGINPTLNFVQGLASRTKAYNGITLYDLVAGVHDPSQLSAVESSMDGTVTLKEEGGKYLLSVRGLSGIKTKDFLEYRFDEKGLDIVGIFSYNYIQ